MKRLAIEGMHCAHCKKRIETIASETPGICWAEVDLAAGILRYAEKGTVDLESLKRAVTEAGFSPRDPA
ncbi:MAG: cation transporter [Desulfovibrio sp.]|nr:cation transporter [Desulfovibrio sp.]